MKNDFEKIVFHPQETHPFCRRQNALYFLRLASTGSLLKFKRTFSLPIWVTTYYFLDFLPSTRQRWDFYLSNEITKDYICTDFLKFKIN